MMEQTKKNNNKILFGIVALVVVVGLVFGIYRVAGPKTSEGSKAITIQVTDNEGEVKEYSVKTDAEFLRQAMEETEGLTFSGSESEFGMYVETVNGVTADFNADGAYWSFYVNGEYGQFGIDAQPVTDGDVYGIVYEVYTAQ